MEIDPITKFMKLSKSLLHLLLPLCSTAQHLLAALSLQSVTSSCNSIDKPLHEVREVPDFLVQ